ncbi:MAG TPA: cytochrome c-type biogenesis protein [Gammaproteobacteria bacterium]|nr:cytochrome c-type biogenesis protein [Gammaproteobacteria bacterium]
MRRTLHTLVLCIALAGAANAADLPVSFESPDARDRYDTLLEELRCLVCQNQSLADSHADLAQDLRDEVYAMVVDGKDNETVIDFMVARYGDFVRYKPPVKSSTWLLWFGPLLLLLLAATIVYITTRARNRTPQPLSGDERARVATLIDGDPD